MHHLSPADELAEIRAEIARLKLREAQLRDAFLRAPAAATSGRWTRVEVVETHQLVFDAQLLPAAIRDNPAYRRDRVVKVVKCLALQPRPTPRPGWPIRRDAVSLH